MTDLYINIPNPNKTKWELKFIRNIIFCVACLVWLISLIIIIWTQQFILTLCLIFMSIAMLYMMEFKPN